MYKCKAGHGEGAMVRVDRKWKALLTREMGIFEYLKRRKQ